MSSSIYSACLNPDPRLRFAVIATGRLLVATGYGLIVFLPIDVLWRLSACLIWGVCSLVELRHFHIGYRRYGAMRLLADGAVQLLNRDQEWVTAHLQNGSVLLRRVGWLRVRVPGGGHFAELLCGDGRRCQEWRRFQVIWRHIGATE